MSAANKTSKKRKLETASIRDEIVAAIFENKKKREEGAERLSSKWVKENEDILIEEVRERATKGLQLTVCVKLDFEVAMMDKSCKQLCSKKFAKLLETTYHLKVHRYNSTEVVIDLTKKWDVAKKQWIDECAHCE